MGTTVRFSGLRPLAPPACRAVEEILTRVLDDHGLRGELSVVFVSDEEIRAVHRDFMDDDTPTDVITFPLDVCSDAEDPTESIAGVTPTVGELVISVDTARREAAARGLAFERELALYALHGALHLVGFDDIDDADRLRMREEERRYLDGFSF